MATAFYVSGEKRIGGRLRKFYFEYPETDGRILVQTYPYRKYSAEEARGLLKRVFREFPNGFGLKIEAAH